MASSLSLQAMCQIAGARHGDGAVAVLAGAQSVVGVVPLDEQRQRLAEFLGDRRGIMHIHQPL